MSELLPGKISKYVIDFELEQSVILSNILWRTFLKLDEAESELWRQREGSARFPYSDFPTELVRRLRAEKILIESDLDEESLIVRRYQETRYSPHALGLTIAPTIDCNFACTYCYEDKRAGRMTRGVEAQLISYVRQLLPGRKFLSVTWYGGEPLLYKETIYRLSEEFIRICELNECKYTSDIVTNGYLLTADVVGRLAAIGHLDGVQVTIDGEGAAHNIKRPTKSGHPTFQRVVGNLLYACTRLPVTLRMNVDLLNPTSCHRLLELLAAQGAAPELLIYFAPIHPFGRGCRDVADEANVRIASNLDFARIEPELTRHARALGFRTSTVFGGQWLVQCQAVSSNAYVVEPDGSLQRCWIEVGEDDKRVGHISRPIKLNAPNSLRWIKFDPTRNEPCRSCKVLPLCFGGCPHRHIYGAPQEFACNQIRYNIRERLVADYVAKYEPELVAPFEPPRSVAHQPPRPTDASITIGPRPSIGLAPPRETSGGGSARDRNE